MKQKYREKLNGRDLITLGILGAVGLVGYLVISVIMCTTIIGCMIATAIASMLTGIVYMLMAAKVKKRGVFLVVGILFGLISMIGGHFYHMILSLIGGVLAEVCAGKYKCIWGIVLAYVVFSVFNYAGVYLPNLLLGINYVIANNQRFGYTAEDFVQITKFYTINAFFILGAVNIITSFIGGVIGVHVLKKHFIKAGLITEGGGEL